MTDRTVIVVTGASKGLGRGMAREFGKSGATVYITSRPQSMAALTAAAAEIDAAGGKGIAVAVDHRRNEDVAALFERVDREQGRLDILVNNAASVRPNELTTPKPFWEKSVELGDMIDVGLRTNYTSSYYAAPLLIKTPRSLIANISFYGAVTNTHGPAYGAAKAGTDKMSFDMAQDFKPFGVSSVSLWPGPIYSDEVDAYVSSCSDPEMRKRLEAQFSSFERPEFTARVIAAIHADPQPLAFSGQTHIVAELGEKLGIRDVDGRQPPSLRAHMGGPATFKLAQG